MVLAVFGGSGRTGRALIQAATAQGWSVRALCRQAAQLDAGSHLHVLCGELTSVEDIEHTMDGAEAVCCVFGPRPPYQDVFCAAATQAIIDAMRRRDVRRLVCQTGAMIGPDVPNWTTGIALIARAFRRQHPIIAEDRAQQEAIVKRCDRAWTLVKPPRLTSGPRTSRIRAGADLRVGLLSKISRLDLATFILSECLAPRFIGQAVYVMT